jgi:hypothetical protein
VRGDLLRLFERPAVTEICRDPGRAKGVIADADVKTGSVT